MPAQLVPLDDGPSILIDKPILLLGRHPECDIQIESRKVSRRHCCIAQVSDYLVVRDLGSTNGIRINGQRVNEGQLHEGDELTIGHFRYQVSWDDVNQAAPRPVRRANPAVRSVGDSLLERCEDPIALPDPDAAALEPAPRKLERPVRLPRTTREPDPPPLPGNLELMPGSGIHPPLPPSSPPPR
jgi:predicted component of type VI protein secretion system